MCPAVIILVFVFGLVFVFVINFPPTRHRGLGHGWCLLVDWLTWKTDWGCTPKLGSFEIGLAELVTSFETRLDT